MGFINFMIFPMPVLFTLISLWVMVRTLDSYPETAYAEIRWAKRWSLVYLVLTLIFVGVSIYKLPDMLHLIQLLDK